MSKNNFFKYTRDEHQKKRILSLMTEQKLVLQILEKCGNNSRKTVKK